LAKKESNNKKPTKKEEEAKREHDLLQLEKAKLKRMNEKLFDIFTPTLWQSMEEEQAWQSKVGRVTKLISR